MLKNTVLATVLTAAAPMLALAADDQDLAEIRAQIRVMQQSYEARLYVLEQRLQQAQFITSAAAPTESRPQPVSAVLPPPASAPAAPGNVFNPAISLILGGTLSNLSQDPNQYHLQGFVPSGGEVGPGKRGFNLGESELTMTAGIDPQFAGQLTFSLAGDNTVSIEEAFVQTRALSNGLNLKAGRFLSSLGYLNGQHAHTWDFVDAPLAYQAFFGGQYKPDGVQAKWLAPSDTFMELGLEASSGTAFPGNDRNKNGVGAVALFAHVGDDIGNASSWRGGLSYLRTGFDQRSFKDPIPTLNVNATLLNATLSGKSAMWIADAIYKWAPNGNPTDTNIKLQGEYLRSRESGTLGFNTTGQPSNLTSENYRSVQSGWYVQGVYQFMPMWRTGLRHDKLSSGNLPVLEAYSPSRTSLMIDYSPSEFSRLRLQLARDQSYPGAIDHQIFLQYIMSLGTHAAHSF